MEFDPNPSAKEERFENPDWSIEDTNSNQLLELPEPEIGLYKKEKNRFRRDLLEKIEKECLEYHPLFKFWGKTELQREEVGIYAINEAKLIIQTTDMLNEEQKSAVIECEESLAIHSLAGTGKTSSLSSAIAYLIATGVAPDEIAVCSHTVAAAEEIKSRVPKSIQKLFPLLAESEAAQKPHGGTIHALARREMVKHRHPKGQCLILEESAQIRIWQEARKFADPYLEQEEAKKIDNNLRLFDRIRGWDIPDNMILKSLSLIAQNGILNKTAENYQLIKEKRNLIDYTDLLRHWTSLVIHPGYKGKWKYIFVDEFQDTSPIQKFILKLLSQGGTKIIVCGDNCQSINSFSGSDPSSDEPFIKEINAQERWLETNYRCSPEIIELANHILERSQPRTNHRLKGKNPSQGIKVQIRKPKFIREKSEDQAEAIASALTAQDVKDELEKITGRKCSTAILYRTNNQGTTLEEQIVEINQERKRKGEQPISYLRKDSRRTALRQKVERDITSCLIPFQNTKNSMWESILTTPYFPGIGEVTAQKIAQSAKARKCAATSDLWNLFENKIPRKTVQIVGTYLVAIEEALAASQASDGEEEKITCEAAHKAFTNWAQLAPESTKEKSTKAEMEEAQKRAYEGNLLARLAAGKNTLLGDWIKAQNEKAEKENEIKGDLENPDEETQSITLSTIHLSKGKEYDGVVINGFHRGSLPHYNSLFQDKNPEKVREKMLRKYIAHPSIQKKPEEEAIIFADPEGELPKITRNGFEYKNATTELEIWDDWNNPIEEERRLLYVAVTRARMKLVLISRADKHPFLSEKVWGSLEKG